MQNFVHKTSKIADSLNELKTFIPLKFPFTIKVMGNKSESVQ